MLKLSQLSLRRQETFLTLATTFIPICVYIAASFWIDPEPIWKIILISTLGLIYFAISFLLDGDIVFSSKKNTYFYFIIMSLIGLTINFAASPGYMWIILAPLLGVAESVLNKVGRWIMYATILIGSGGPYIYNYGWDTWYVFILYTPALLFIVTFTRLTLKANQDREKAESLTKALEEANRKLGEFAIQAEEMATTQERNRIAREIHDNLGHYLTVINVQLEAAKVTFDLKPEKARDAINKAQNLTKDGLGAIRNSIATLRESPVANRPIPDALADLIRETEQSGITTDFKVSAEHRLLPPNAALTLYRIVQEALTNVRKHANASQVSVILDYHEPETVYLKISDNGIGSAGTGSGFGLMGIAERVASLGGTLDIDTAPEAGFSLAISIPG
ncbi:MAG: signal transduction histidine kinase [Candidatus Promineifilaceae bacterium]|jgi:signal transduction histidine kinase